MRLQKAIGIVGWLLVTLSFFQNISQAQSIRFSGFYDSNNGAGLIESVVVQSDGTFIGVGSNLNSSNDNNQDGHHVLIDEDGQLIEEHAFVFPGKTFNTQQILRDESTGSLYSSGYFCDFAVPSPSYCDFYFTKVDETGDTLFTAVYERTDTCDLVLDMVQTRPNKIMLIGWTCNDSNQDNTELMFITVDTLGNELNRVVWGGDATDFISSGAVVDSIGNVVMAGYTKSFPFVSANIRTLVIRTDSVGNVQWRKTYNGPWGSGSSAARIASLPNGNLIIAGGSQTFGGSSFGVDAALMEIDTAGNQIWAKEYEVEGGQGLWGVIGLDDGTIVSCGVTDGPSGSQAGWLVKTDENGDTLWTRTYDSSDEIDFLRNMIALPNGDIVMVGFGRPAGQTNQDGWILRVDSMGCEVEGCWTVGVEDLPFGSAQRMRLAVYPNPSIGGEVTIECNLKRGDAAELRVFDAMGRQVFSEGGCFGSSNLAMTGSCLLDVSGWSEGIYHCVLAINGSATLSEKLVIVKG